jgi:hypothetical protein
MKFDEHIVTSSPYYRGMEDEQPPGPAQVSFRTRPTASTYPSRLVRLVHKSWQRDRCPTASRSTPGRLARPVKESFLSRLQDSFTGRTSRPGLNLARQKRRSRNQDFHSSRTSRQGAV